MIDECLLYAMDLKQQKVRTRTARDGTRGAVDRPVKTMRQRAQRISCEPRYPCAFSVKTQSATQQSKKREM